MPPSSRTAARRASWWSTSARPPRTPGAPRSPSSPTKTWSAPSNPAAGDRVGGQWQTMPMRNLIVVAFLEPVTEGMDFPRDAWPLHITLVKFDVVGQPPDGEQPHEGDGTDADNVGDAAAVAGDALAARVAALLDAPVRAALGSTLTVGGEAGFGRGGSVPVSLIEIGRASCRERV